MNATVLTLALNFVKHEQDRSLHPTDINLNSQMGLFISIPSDQISIYAIRKVITSISKQTTRVH